MKIWRNFGSEHSSNLVMIGHFKDARDAEHAKQIIDLLAERANSDGTETSPDGRFNDETKKELRSLELYTLAAPELEQLLYGASLEVEGADLVLTTDEIDVSVFLKIMVHKGARVEVYSAHDHKDSGHGRRT